MEDFCNKLRSKWPKAHPLGFIAQSCAVCPPCLGLSRTLFSDCFGPPAGPQEYYPGCWSLALCKGLDWLPSVAMGNSPLSLHHHLLPIIGRRGPCVLGGGVFSQERCVTLAQPPRPWGLAPFQGCILPPPWLHLVRFFCSAASPHLGPPPLETPRPAAAAAAGQEEGLQAPLTSDTLPGIRPGVLLLCLRSVFTWVYSLLWGCWEPAPQGSGAGACL